MPLRRRQTRMHKTGHLIGLIVLFLLTVPAVGYAESDEACSCVELTPLELVASAQTLVDATVVSVDEVSERVAVATLDVHAVYSGAVAERTEIILDRTGDDAGPCAGLSLLGGAGVTGVFPLRRQGDQLVADRCTHAIQPERFHARVLPIDLDPTGGNASFIGFGSRGDASVFALDASGAVIAANRIKATRAAAFCDAGTHAGVLLGTRIDSPLSLGFLDIETLRIVESRTFPDLRSNGVLRCTSSGELFAGLYDDNGNDGTGGWLRLRRSHSTAEVVADPGNVTARVVSSDRVATVTGGGPVTDGVAPALRLTVLDIASGSSRTTTIDGPPDARVDDVGLSGNDLAIAFIGETAGESTTEVWIYVLSDGGAEYVATESLGAPPIDGATRHRFAAFGFTESMRVAPTGSVVVQLEPETSINLRVSPIGVSGTTPLLTTSYGIATSTDGTITMLDTPFKSTGRLDHAILLGEPVAVGAIRPEEVAAKPPQSGFTSIEEAVRSELWRDYPVFTPPRDPALDAQSDRAGWLIIAILGAGIAAATIGAITWRRAIKGRSVSADPT